MKNIFKIVLPIMLLLISSISVAQQQPNVTPMEFYSNCEFQPGKTKADLYKVIEKWNKFNDRSNDNSYTAFLLTPIAASNVDFENTLIWMGAWNNFEGMGKSLENYYILFGSAIVMLLLRVLLLMKKTEKTNTKVLELLKFFLFRIVQLMKVLRMPIF